MKQSCSVLRLGRAITIEARGGGTRSCDIRT